LISNLSSRHKKSSQSSSSRLIVSVVITDLVFKAKAKVKAKEEAAAFFQGTLRTRSCPWGAHHLLYCSWRKTDRNCSKNSSDETSYCLF